MPSGTERTATGVAGVQGRLANFTGGKPRVGRGRRILTPELFVSLELGGTRRSADGGVTARPGGVAVGAQGVLRLGFGRTMSRAASPYAKVQIEQRFAAYVRDTAEGNFLLAALRPRRGRSRGSGRSVHVRGTSGATVPAGGDRRESRGEARTGVGEASYTVADMRWFIGDLQGCARELDDLLKKIRFSPGSDELWCLGDLVNRGPDSLAAVRLWRDVGGRGVIGNHDVYALLVHGGRWPRKHDTLSGLFVAHDGVELLSRMRAMNVLEHLPAATGSKGPDVWAVHAGLHPRWTDLHQVAARANRAPHDDEWLESYDVSFMTRVRCCTESGERSKFDRKPEDCPPPYRPWDEHYRGDTLVIHGHWAWRGYYRGPKSIGLDSGCVYGGMLTAWCQDEDRIVQVAARGPG